MTEPIVKIILHYRPEWEPPVDTGRDWSPCLCPFHSESNRSASVSFRYNAFRCHGCPARGNVHGLIMNREGVSYSEAVRLATAILGESYQQVQRTTPRKPSRGLSSHPGVVDSDDSPAVRSGIRGRPRHGT